MASDDLKTYCIWYPEVASEETYRKLAKAYPDMVYAVGRACAVAGYDKLYHELNILPEVSIAEEARLGTRVGRGQHVGRLKAMEPSIQYIIYRILPKLKLVPDGCLELLDIIRALDSYANKWPSYHVCTRRTKRYISVMKQITTPQQRTRRIREVGDNRFLLLQPSEKLTSRRRVRQPSIIRRRRDNGRSNGGECEDGEAVGQRRFTPRQADGTVDEIMKQRRETIVKTMVEECRGSI